MNLLQFRSYAIVSAVSLSIGFGGGYWLLDQMAASEKLKAARAETRAAVKVIERVVRADAITAKVGEASAARQEKIRTVYRDIIREVPVYVSPEADRRFPLSRGFVRVLDDAIAGAAPTVPDASAPPDDTASPVAASTAASILVSDIGQCKADQGRLSDLQGWIRAQAAEWGKP